MAKNLPHIYKKSKTGDLVKVSAKEVKAFIMSAHGWTSEEYTKKRDIFKNRLRAFESFQRAQGKEVKSQNVVELLYKQAKAMKYYGKEYQPSQEIKRIEGFSAVSITKGRQQAKRQGKAFNAINQRQINYLKDRFGDWTAEKGTKFVNVNAGAKRIVETFYENAQKDGKPVNATKLEEALSDYADSIHAKIAEEADQQSGETIPSGESYGSDTDTDFDVSAYLD
jgi:hypothetical protein